MNLWSTYCDIGVSKAGNRCAMIEIIKDINELQSLQDQLNELADLMERPLLRHEWIVTTADCFFPRTKFIF